MSSVNWKTNLAVIWVSQLLSIAGFLIFWGAREEFSRPQAGPPVRGTKPKRAFADLRHGWPILLLLGAMSFARQFETTFFPLLIQQILGTLQGAALWTGALSATAAGAGFLAGIVFGRLADLFRPPRIAQMAAVSAGLFMFFHGLAPTFLFIGAARFGMTFCAGGLVHRAADEWAVGSGIRYSRHLFCRSLPVHPAAAADILGRKAAGSRD